jgi:NitT/TauT family transport system ATP-binding protein
MATSFDGATPLSGAHATVPLLRVSGVTLQYKTDREVVTATFRVDCVVNRSERFVILGPSGCGKSTLLKAIGGFLNPTEGVIEINGKRVSKPGPDRVMVFQEFDQLMAWKTVKQNVVFALEASGRLMGAAAESRAVDYLRKVHLEQFLDSYPHTLSGGMKQRVAIARGMAMEPDMILMDEPFAALDALTRQSMQDEILRLWNDTRFTVVFVTHSIAEAVKIGTRILVLSPHPGQVQAEFLANGPDFTPADATELESIITDMLFANKNQAIPQLCSNS